MTTSSGTKTFRVSNAGRIDPAKHIDRLAFMGLGVVFSLDTAEIGLALSARFTNAHRYTWKHEWFKARHAASQIKAAREDGDKARTMTLTDFLWYDFATLHEVCNVPRPLLLDRINKGYSAAMLYKPVGYDRLADARLHGLEWNGERRSITEWCEEIGIGYKTLCARLASDGMPLDNAMTNGRAMGRTQKQVLMTPDLAMQLDMARIKYQTYYSRIRRGWPPHLALSQPHTHYKKGRGKKDRTLEGDDEFHSAAKVVADPDYNPSAFEPLPSDALTDSADFAGMSDWMKQQPGAQA